MSGNMVDVVIPVMADTGIPVKCCDAAVVCPGCVKGVCTAIEECMTMTAAPSMRVATTVSARRIRRGSVGFILSSVASVPVSLVTLLLTRSVRPE